MENATGCILCSSDRLRTIACHTFRRSVLPGGIESDVANTYVSDRLAFLFDHLAAGYEEISFYVVECRECGMVFNNPRLTGEEMAEKYRYLSNTPGTRAAMRKEPHQGQGKRADYIYGRICEAWGALPRSLRVLDYGGANGLNLVPFAGENECLVVDFVEHPLPSGVEYIQGDVGCLDHNAVFEVILLCCTLEHIVRPVELLRQLVSHLTDGGLLYVEVPLGVFREWRKQAEPLTHVNFFSESTIARCLTSAGLSPARVSTDFKFGISGRSWSVNAIGIKEEHLEIHKVRCRGVRRQMISPAYYIRPGFRKLARMAHRS